MTYILMCTISLADVGRTFLDLAITKQKQLSPKKAVMIHVSRLIIAVRSFISYYYYILEVIDINNVRFKFDPETEGHLLASNAHNYYKDDPVS